MPSKTHSKTVRFKQLNAFLEQNPVLNLSSTNLSDEQTIGAMNWTGLTRYKASILEQIKTYQRLLLILPPQRHELILDLMHRDIKSVLQIASMPKSKFEAEFIGFFGNDHELLDATYAKASDIRSRLLIRHMQQVQSEKGGVL